MDKKAIALNAINNGYDGLYLSPIQDALFDAGFDIPISDDDGNTSDIILEIESIADNLLNERA